MSAPHTLSQLYHICDLPTVNELLEQSLRQRGVAHGDGRTAVYLRTGFMF
jgi:hypothetical protein